MQEGYEYIGQDIHEFINQIQDEEIRFICSGIILDGKTIKSIDNFRTKVNNGGIDKIFIIRIEE